MPKTVTILNLRSITELRFTVPRAGVHLLAGTNGSGKTTLLACLRRLGQANAFPLHFPASTDVNVDDFSAARIIYDVDGRTVTYSYAGERWVPIPRASSDVLQDFGYPDVRYAGATAERITPRGEDFQSVRPYPAPASIINAANEIFDTDRFTQLRTINLSRGNRNQALLLANHPTGRRAISYITERNFSLGELCVLKLLRALAQCRNGSLVLIDELELALHPRAQIGLFNYLEHIASDKALTIIVSTHSVTLIKNAKRNQILYLEKGAQATTVIKGCFPAYAIGGLALTEERTPDVAIYVEDEAACSVTFALSKLAVAARYPAGTAFPTVQVTPIGDFNNVVRYYDRSRGSLPDYVKQWILLDADVQQEALAIMAPTSNNAMRDLFHAHYGRIRYLPWSPEVGLVEFLRTHRVGAERELRTRMQNAQIHIAPAMLVLPNVTGADLRRAAKQAAGAVVRDINNQATNWRAEAIADELYTLLAESYFATDPGPAMQLMGPLVA